MPSADAQFDLAVIGGGPAGSSSAITAARLGARVLLLEARDFPRHKVCGEFVSAEALDVLGGLLQAASTSEALFSKAPVVDRTRIFQGSRVVEATVSPPALSIPRYDLDSELWTAAQASGVERRAHSEVLSVEGDGPFQLQTSSVSFMAKALVAAAGRWSQLTPDRTIPPGPKWIGLKAHFRETNPAPSSDLYFFEKGYCGVQPVAKGTVNACAMVRSDLATTLPQVFQLNPSLAERASGWKQLFPTVSTAPLVYRTPLATRGNVVFAGDAAAFIDPFVGDGISIALRSGQVAAQSINKFLSGETTLGESVAHYQREYERQFEPLLAVASRVRSLLSLPLVARLAIFELLRFPGLIPFVIRKTRQAV
jgi:flavin-dependent dehydrogenase